jgi:hypothetical protein
MNNRKFQQTSRDLRFALTSIILFFCLSGCQKLVLPTEQVQLAAFKQVIGLGIDNTKLYFVSTNAPKTDPSSSFLEQAKRFAPGVLPSSAGSTTPPFLEIQTGKPGIIVNLGQVHFQGANLATVNCDVLTGRRGSQGILFTLEFQKGRWVVVKSDLGWIS